MRYAWLFPGQGAQSVGMGRALAESSSAARAVFDEADDALGFSLSKLCFDGPEEELTLTKYTQPAIVTVSVAALAALREAIPNLPDPAFVLGHSLGEYSALVAAGALTFADAVKLVHLRGQAMQEAVPPGVGGMAAVVGADAASVEALCKDAAEGEVLSPANFNGPGQIVIAGTASAIERAAALAASQSMKLILLKVSAPFHCSLMQSARAKVEAALAPLPVQEAKFPIIANVTAKPHTEAALTRRLLVEQVDSAVRWQQSVELLAQEGIRGALELGPGKVLAGLQKRINKEIPVLSIGTPEGIEAARDFLGALS